MNLCFKTRNIKTSPITFSFSSFLLIPGVNLQLFLFRNLTLDMCQAGPSGRSYFSFTGRFFGSSICFFVPSILLWPGIHLIKMSCP